MISPTILLLFTTIFLNPTLEYKIYDLSHGLKPNMPNRIDYLEDFNQSGIKSNRGIKKRSFCALENAGTHLNAPFKINEDTQAVHEIPIEKLLAPLIIINISTTSNINKNNIENWENLHGPIQEGSVVALRSKPINNWHQGKEAYLGFSPNRPVAKYAGFEVDACTFLAEKKIIGVGIDTLSLDGSKYDNFTWSPCHKILAVYNIYVLENLNLNDVPIRGTMIFVGTLNIAYGTGSPARIFAVQGPRDFTPPTLTTTPKIQIQTTATVVEVTTTKSNQVKTTTKPSKSSNLQSTPLILFFFQIAIGLYFKQLI